MLSFDDEYKLYTNNIGRKSFQWQVWPFCNNGCKFCFLGETNKEYIKTRQHKSLNDLSKAIDNLDYSKYNNMSLIGGEFFQGQLADQETHELFINVIKKIFKLYVDKKIGSIWLTATLTTGDEKDLYEVLRLAESMGVLPVEGYGASGIWLCTSWDPTGRFDEAKKKHWETYIKKIKQDFPWIKLNTTIILQKSFIDLYLSDGFKPNDFMKEYNTTLFYMQPCITGITQMMVAYEKMPEELKNTDFSKLWMERKQNMQKEYEFFPTRKSFISFLNKYWIEDRDTFDRLFNIRFRSDEIHINENQLDHDITISREKTSNKPEEAFPPVMKCGHVYNYAPYIDSNHCCICDKEQICNV